MEDKRAHRKTKGTKKPTDAPDTTLPATSAPQSAEERKPGAGGKSEHGGYRVLSPLASGGMGQVSLAEDRLLKRQVVIKEIREKLAGSQEARSRFVAEARITGQLEHPGVVPVYALGVDSHGHPFYAMRRVQGDTLKEAIANYHTQPSSTKLRELLRRFVAVCQTVAYAHARGVFHRDLKPSNVMLGDFGETLVLDWGLAKAAAGASPESTIGDLAEQMLEERLEETLPGAEMGSPPYMSPEQAEGRAFAVGPAADIYALGAILYDILTGKPPYSGESSADVIQKIRSTSPPKPSEIGAGVPRPLEAICLKAMARADTERYPDALAVASDVQNWLDDERVSVYQESVLERTWRWARRHRAAVACSVVVLISIFAAITIGTLVTERERVRRAAAERLAEESAKRAADAERKAEEKEQQAEQKAKEAAEARKEAVEALKQRAQAEREKASFLVQIAQLQSDIKLKTAEAEQLNKQLESLRGQLAAAEQLAANQLEKARLAKERAESLGREAAALRREAEQLRREASEAREQALPEPSAKAPDQAPQTESLVDLTEGNAAMFAINSTDGAFSLLSDDDAKQTAGRYSLRVDSLSDGEIWVTYPADRSAKWDLSAYGSIRLAISVDDAARDRFQKLLVRLGRGSSYWELQPEDALLDQAGGDWLEASIPISGGGQWTRTETNHPDLAQIDWIEIHAAAGGRATLWLDNLGFAARERPAEAVAPFDAAQAKKHQQAWADYLALPVERDMDLPGGETLTLVLIPPGEFAMGSSDEEIAELLRKGEEGGFRKEWADRMRSEGPQHSARITKPFYLAAYEVTVGQFKTFVEATGYKTDAETDGKGGTGWVEIDGRQTKVRRPEFTWRNPGFEQTDLHPVTQVSWNDAVAFCRWLGEKETTTCRLPTEAEWEYACRAGSTTRWHFGDNEADLDQYAWHGNREGYNTKAVGQKLPNAFGIFDSHGNLREWSLDWYSEDYYGLAPVNDPQGPSTGAQHVLRGGAFHF
jgi:formylglycine-generating enzyme required for sulfatase activity/serine/threonine protein kinase